MMPSDFSVPRGFRLSGVHCGIKQDPAKEDLTLVVCDQPTTAAAVYTQNRVFSAPVAVDRERTPAKDIRAVVINSGNANACTGEQGRKDADEMVRLASAVVNADPRQALVMSTGVIGEMLPMDKITAGVAVAKSRLGADEASLHAAARGMMTTDKSMKLASRQLELAGERIILTGMAKGAGMIGPNMATMLGLVMTDAALSSASAQQALAAAVDESFNCISVEGHTSTSDTVILLASGKSSGAATLDDGDLDQFQTALTSLCIELAKMIPNDGEGSSHLIEIKVQGCRTKEDARQIAKTVAQSNLVKTAIAGADPNWGRIVSAAGYAGVEFGPEQVDLSINDVNIYRQGAPIPFDAAGLSRSIRSQRDTKIMLTFAEGDQAIDFWTSDLTVDYVQFNSDYHT